MSISLSRSGTSEELEGTSTLLASIGGEGASEDFTSVNIAAFFNKGDTEATVVIAAVQDTVPEIDELFTFQLQYVIIIVLLIYLFNISSFQHIVRSGIKFEYSM